MIPNAQNAPAEAVRKRATEADVGRLPEWDLRDLYASIDDPQVTRDLERADAECIAFEQAYRGKLGNIAASPDAGAALAGAVERYEAIDELLGRLDSYAGLLYAGNTTDPARAKFYGDVRDRLTAASTHLLFFTLDLNRIDDAVLDPALAHPRLARYRPWFEDIRKERPYQLEDRVEQLFHEKSVTSRAWHRLFDETLASLRFKVDGEELLVLNLPPRVAGVEEEQHRGPLVDRLLHLFPRFDFDQPHARVADGVVVAHAVRLLDEDLVLHAAGVRQAPDPLRVGPGDAGGRG